MISSTELKPGNRATIIILAILLLSAFILPADAFAQEQADEIPPITEIRLIRKLGEYDQAKQYLEALLEDKATPDETRKEAYNELVTILLETEGRDAAKPVAIDAVKEFPTIEADRAHHPPETFELYEQLSRLLFGKLILRSNPKDCDVYLDGKHVGKTPLEDVYVYPGKHSIRLSRYEYRDKTIETRIGAGQTVTHDVELKSGSKLKHKRFGFEIGLSNVSLKYGAGNDFQDIGTVGSYSSINRLSGGVFMQAFFHEGLALQVGLRYAPMGNTAYYQMFGTENPDGKYECKMNYIVLPVLFRQYLTKDPGLMFIAGPELGFLTKAELTEENGSTTIDLKSSLPSIELFLTIGIGLEKKVSSRARIMVSGYFTMGLFNLRDETRYETIQFKPQEFRVSAGLSFQ